MSDSSAARSLGASAWLVACLLLSPVAGAEIYTWTDESGRVHFGDKPAEGTEAETVTTQDASGSSGDLQGRQEKLRRLLDTMEAERRQRAEGREATLAERKENTERCQQVREELAHTEEGIFYRDTDDPLNPEFVAQAEVDAYRAELRKAEKKFCG